MASSPQCGSTFDKLLSLKFLDDPTIRVFYPTIASHYWEWPLSSLSIQPIGSIRRMDNFIDDPTRRVSFCSIRRMGNIMLDLTYWVLHPKIASHYWQWPLASLSIRPIRPIRSIQRTDNFLHDLTSRVSTRQLHLVILMMSACIFVATSSMQWNWTPRINTEKRVCIPRSLCVSRELTVLCQYTDFQNLSVNKHPG